VVIILPETITLDMNTKSIKYLCKKDKRLAKVISMVGPITYKPYEDGYKFLVDTIIGQMLSNRVADAISNRMGMLCGGMVHPKVVVKLSDAQIHNIGLSQSKVSCIKGLTKAVVSGDINLKQFHSLSDEDVLGVLTSFRGIGPWSAKMYLIFVLNRQNILPYEDAAFRQAYCWLYNTKNYSTSKIKERCKKWNPYASLASRYLYRALDRGMTKKYLF
jgi:DNA-3-methyladenine glycosylase II